MHLSQLKIWNFRRFGSQTKIDLQKPNLIVPFRKEVNLLIGENDSGKSAIVDAIRLVLGTHSNEWVRVDRDDFYEGSTELRIECEFEDLAPAEAKNFIEWLSWKGELPNITPILKVFLQATLHGERILPYEVKAGSDEDGYALKAEAREYLKTTYLRPLRDAKAELAPRRNSRLSQILLAHEAFRTNGSEHQFEAGMKALNKGIESYFKGEDGDGNPLPETQQAGLRLKGTIDGYLQDFAGFDSKFEMNGGKLRAILESLCLLFQDKKNLGLGSHNLLCIASELLHLQKKDWTGVRLGLIEEVEAHLHPQVQMQVMHSLHAIADKADIQLIFTTHSPNIGSKIPLANLLLCNQGGVFPMGEKYTQLAATDYRFLQRFLDVSKANLFFAKGVILVEGWAEELIIPALAERIGVNLTKHGVSIINIGSTAFLRYSRVFQRQHEPHLKIPVAVVTDVDIKPLLASPLKTEVGVDGIPRRAQRTQADVDAEITEAKKRKADKYDGQAVKAFVSDAWTLEYCLALAPSIRQLFYKSVLQALKEEREDAGIQALDKYSQALQDYKAHFNNWADDERQIAFEITNQILAGKNRHDLSAYPISKSIIAQFFAENLLISKSEELNLRNEPSIRYLVQAIDYAISNI